MEANPEKLDLLLQGKQSLEQFIKGVPIGTFVLNKDHKVVFWNEACENLLETKAKDVIGTTNAWKGFYTDREYVLADLIVSENTEAEILRKYQGLVWKSKTIEGAFEGEKFFPHLGENGKFLFFTAAPIKDENGKVIGAIETLQDQTEKKAALADAEEKRLQLSTLFQNLPGMAYRCLYNTEWTMIIVSDGCKKLTGYNRDEIINSTKISYNAIIHPDDRDVVKKTINDASSKSKSFMLEYRIVDKSGKIKWVWEQGTFTNRFNENNIEYLEGFVADITDEKKAKDYIKEQNRLNDIKARLWQIASDPSITDKEQLIEALLACIGPDLDVSRVSYLPFEADKNAFVIKHQWCRDKVEHTKGEIIPLELVRLFKFKHFVRVPHDLEKLEAKKELKPLKDQAVIILDKLKIKSLLIGLFGSTENPIALFTFSDTDEKKNWLDLHNDIITETANLLHVKIAQLEHEKERIESEQKYHNLVEYSLEGLYIIQDNIIQFCNNKLAEIFGFENAEALTGTNIKDLVHPSSWDVVDTNVKLREAGKKHVSQYRYKGKKKDGSIIYLETLGSQIVYNGKQAVQGAIRDITESHLAEERLRKLDRSVEQSPTSIVITNLQGEIEYVNPKFEAITGFKSHEVLGENPSVLKSGHTSPDDYKRLWTTILAGNEWHGEFLNKKKNGDFFWESASISPVKNERGEITHFIAVKEDVTEGKKIQEELVLAKEKAEEADRLKTAFLANMSHEIRTPMNAIMGFSALLTDPDVTDAEKKEYIDLINNNSNNLLNLIDDIIDIAKIEAQQLKVFNKEFSLKMLLNELYAVYSEEKKKQSKDHIELSLTIPEKTKSVRIFSDPHRIRQVLSNLIGNALKYTEKGKITFGYFIQTFNREGVESQMIQFYVKDTGLGIPNDKIDLIFDRFRQADDSHTREYGGTGLGLAISKNIASLLGGNIQAVSKVGKGSVFYFTIPYNPIEEKPVKSDVSAKSLSDVVDWSDKSILIAEDVSSNYQLLETILKRTKVNLLWARNGKEAIEMVQQDTDIQLILMDLQMPVINGYEATKQIKEVKSDIPILAVTAFALAGDKEKAMEAGCDGYLSKPIKSRDLLAKISNYLS